MKKIKRIQILGILLSMLFTIAFNQDKVWADEIYEPLDSFLKENKAMCEEVDRYFVTNGPNGRVVVYQSPESGWTVDSIKNGEEIYISVSYTDEKNVTWGSYEGYTESGWIPMEYLIPVYDHTAFVEEYADKIVSEEGTLELYEPAEWDKNIYLWNYPGSKTYYTIMGSETLEYNRVFTDEEGRLWGCTFDEFGYKDKWICLDNPTADFKTLYPDGAPERGEIVVIGSDEAEEIAPSGINQKTIVIIVTAVILLVVITTAIVLRSMKQSDKKNKE